MALKQAAEVTGWSRQRIVRLIETYNAQHPDHRIGWRIGGDRGRWEIAMGRFIRVVRGGVRD
jgi:hypothetical protein